MRLLNNRVLAMKVQEESKTKGGIILPSTGQKNYIKMQVVDFAPEIEGLLQTDYIFVHPETQLIPIEIGTEEMYIFHVGNILSIE